MKIYIAIAVIFFLYPVKKGLSNSGEKELVESVFFLIHNQKYDKAESVLLKNGEQYDKFYTDILQLDLHWWRYVSSPSSRESEKLTHFLKALSKTNQNAVDKNLKQLILLSYRVRFELMRFNIPGAFILRTKIKKLLAEIKKDELHYSRNRLKLYDLYNELFLYFDNIINPLFLESRRKTRTKALQQIEKYTTEDDLIVKTTAHYFLGKIYLNIEKEPRKSTRHFNYLTNKYPDNLIFEELYQHCRNKN